MNFKPHQMSSYLVKTKALLIAILCAACMPTLVHSKSYQQASANCTLQEVPAINPDEKNVIVYIRAFISEEFEFAEKLHTGVTYINDPFPGFLGRSFATDQRHFSDKLGASSRLVVRLVFDQNTLELKRLDAWTYCTHQINRYHLDGSTKEVLATGRHEVSPYLKNFERTGPGRYHRFSIQSENPLVTMSKLGPVVVSGSIYKMVGPTNRRRIIFSVSHMPFFEVLAQNGNETKILKRISPEKGTTFFDLLNFPHKRLRKFDLTVDEKQIEVKDYEYDAWGN